MDTLKIAAQEHIISKQIFELTLFRKENANELQRIVHELYYTSILPELDLKLSEMIAPGSFLRIDRIEIDLGSLFVKDLEHEFTDRLIGCFTEEVAKKMSQSQPLYISNGIKRKASGKTTDSLAHNPTESKILSNEEYKLELLAYFLQNGVLPWWAKNGPKDALKGIFSGLIKNAPEQLKTLMQKIVKHENARSRLIYQFPDTVFYRLARIFIPDKTIQIRNLFYDLNEIFKDITFIPNPSSEFRLIFWDAVFITALAPPKKGSLEKAIFITLIDSIERRYRLSFRTQILLMYAKVSKLIHSEHIFKTGIPEYITELKEDAHKGLSLKENLAESGSRHSTLQPDIIDGATLPSPEALTQTEQFYIQNAGAVILWPYLNIFFQNAGLLKDSGFTSDNSNTRAIHLLEYLVTGKQYTPEHLLVLNKLLCGRDIYKPICKGLKITKTEKKEAEILLSTIISHWQALKNTSIEGLRTSFLQREGVLIEKEEQTWLLQVERKAYDMLLERLPWGISLIRLSWMKTTLYVEW